MITKYMAKNGTVWNCIKFKNGDIRLRPVYVKRSLTALHRRGQADWRFERQTDSTTLKSGKGFITIQEMVEWLEHLNDTFKKLDKYLKETSP